MPGSWPISQRGQWKLALGMPYVPEERYRGAPKHNPRSRQIVNKPQKAKLTHVQDKVAKSTGVFGSPHVS